MNRCRIIFWGLILVRWAHVGAEVSMQEQTRFATIPFVKPPCTVDDWFTRHGDGRKVKKLLKKALCHFDTVCPSKKSVIIFDIDNTALFTGNWADAACFLYRPLPALQEVLCFYQELVARGFKIVFISARNLIGWHFTRRNLIRAGYCHFEKLITRAPDAPCFSYQHFFGSIAAFKCYARSCLRKQGYVIIGSVGNGPHDFDSDCGYCVRLPSYFGAVP